MKHSLLVLALLVVSSATVFAQARYVTITVNPSQPTAPTFTNEVSIAAEEVAELVSFPYVAPALLDVIRDGTTFSFSHDSVNTHAGNKLFIIKGPAVLRLRANGFAAMCTLKITPESFPPDKTLIIPDGTAGATVTLECSTNLINWSTATNGFYSGTNSAKFFRIRAERAQ